MQLKCLNAQSSIFRVTQDDSNAKATLVRLMNEASNNVAAAAPETARDMKELVVPPLPKTRLEITDFPSPVALVSPPSSSE